MAHSASQAISLLESVRPLVDVGFAVHCLHPKGKAPIADKWSSAHPHTWESLTAAHKAGQNLGVRTGAPSLTEGGHLYVIDLDIRDASKAAKAHAKLRELAPDYRSLPTVISGSGGESRHYWAFHPRAQAGWKVAKSEGATLVFDSKLNKEVKKHDWEIEVFGTGKQVVLPGSTHPGGGLYSWAPGSDPDDFGTLGLFPTLPAALMKPETDRPAATTVATAPGGEDMAVVRSALWALPESHLIDYHEWLEIGMALHHETSGAAGGLALWNEWSAQSSGWSAKVSARKWRSFNDDRSGAITIATVYQYAGLNDWENPSRALTQEYIDSWLDGLGDAPGSEWHVPDFDSTCDPDLSQDQLAIDLGECAFNRDARHCPEMGGWILWHRDRWQTNVGALATSVVRNFLRAKAGRLADWAEREVSGAKAALDLAKLIGDADGLSRAEGAVAEAAKKVKSSKGVAKDIRSAASVSAVQTLAQSNRASMAKVEQWDAHDFLLGTPCGTVDLRTGELRPAERKHYITKHTRVAPVAAGTTPARWLRFLGEVFPDDPEMPGFIQRLAGYALTGSTREHRFFLFQGNGRNGKGTLLGTLQGIMGDYAKGIPTATLLEARSPQHAAPLARLLGARFVRGAELPVAQAWNESLVKQLTGGDVITANRMRHDPFDFVPKFTLIVDGNTLPAIRTTDVAMRSRMTLVPFGASFAGREQRGLAEALLREAPEILRWMIDGAVEWTKGGLRIPASVEHASREYLDSEDKLFPFLAERTERTNVDEEQTGTRALHDAYRQWCDGHGRPCTIGEHKFGAALGERGFPKTASGAKRHPLRLLPEPEPFDQ